MGWSDAYTTTTDAKGNIRTEVTDYLGRIIQVQEDTGGGTTNYTYNAAGDLKTVTDAASNVTTINYNTLGQKMSMDDPDMGVWSYTYDLNGNLETQTDAKNQTITFSYDALNRIAQKSYSTSDPDVYYTYDQATNGIGQLYSVTNSNATTTYNSYDVMGRVTSVTKNITGDTNRTTLFTYDYSGKVRTTTYPDNHVVTNSYYAGSNLLNSVTGTGGVSYAFISSYTPSGKIKTLSHGNGSSSIYTYDARSERLSQIETKDASQVIIQKKIYSYTAIGEISSITDEHNNVGYTYTYDDLSRLKTEVVNGMITSVSINYNSIGNITSKTMNGNTFTYAYNHSSHKHAVSRITYGGTNYDYNYDLNGNMTYGSDFTNPASPKIRLISYNADNMPASILYDWTVNTTFLYDGMGGRVKKSVGSTHTYYIGDHFEVQDGTTVKYIFAGNLRVAQVKGYARSYFHKDHLGSSTVMTNALGAEIQSTEYMPFGSQRNHSGTDASAYKFADQELDSENGLYNYNARLYDPIIGRFISPDTIVPSPYNPQSLNRYSYCLNNPLIYTDPSGHEEMLTPEIFAALQELWYYLNGLGYNYGNAYELGASISGLGLWHLNFTGSSGLNLWNSGFEDINAHQQWKAEQKLNEKVKEYAGLEVLHWENKKQGGCGARAGWIKDDLTAEGYDTSYIYVKNTSFTAKNNFQYHVAVKVSSYGKEYVIDPYFWKGRRETLTTEYWLKKVDYSGKSGEHLDVARADNPLWDPDPSGGVTDFPKTWTDPPPKGYGYKNYSYKSTKDFYEIYLRGGHLQ